MLQTTISAGGYQESLFLSLDLCRPHNNRSHSPPGADSPQGSGGQSSNPDNGNKKALAAGLIIGIALGSSLVVFFAMLVIVFCLRKDKRKEPTDARTSSGSLPVSTDKGDRFAWLRDNEFSRQALAGVNPVNIELLTEFPILSKLDPAVYGPPEFGMSVKEVGEQYAKENRLLFFETSAKTAQNVNELFYEIAKRLAKASPSRPTGMKLLNRSQEAGRRAFCCSS